MGKYEVIFYAVGEDRVVSSLRQEEIVEARNKYNAENIISEKYDNSVWISNVRETDE